MNARRSATQSGIRAFLPHSQQLQGGKERLKLNFPSVTIIQLGRANAAAAPSRRASSARAKAIAGERAALTTSAGRISSRENKKKKRRERKRKQKLIDGRELSMVLGQLNAPGRSRRVGRGGEHRGSCSDSTTT